MAYVSSKTGADEVWLWSPDGSPDRQLTRLGARIEAIGWAPSGDALAVASNARGTFDVYRVEVATGATRRLTHDHRYEVYPQFTPDGRILYVRLNESWTDHDVVLMDGDGAEPRVVLQDRDCFDYHYGRTFGYPLVSPDGRWFLFRPDRSGWFNVWAARVDGSGEPRQVAPAEADQSDAAWSPTARASPTSRTTTARSTSEWSTRRPRPPATSRGRWSPPSWASARRRAGRRRPATELPVRHGHLAERRLGRRRRDPREVAADPLDARRRRRRAAGRPREDRLRKLRRRADPRLSLPSAHAPARPALPRLLWIHGGPTSQFMDTYQPMVQYFVRAGYVVLLPNIRGSSGYGRFEALNDRDWGHGDLKDVIQGVEYLKTLPDVDPDSFGITGTSYGGIMSMAAVAFAPPGAFKAAIPCSGYGDFLHMVGEQELRHVKLLEHELGDPGARPRRLPPRLADLPPGRLADALLPDPGRGPLPGIVVFDRLRAGARSPLQAVLVQGVPRRDVLRRQPGQREAAAPRHAGLP